MLMLQFISGRSISFWNLFIYVNNSQYAFYIINFYINFNTTIILVVFRIDASSGKKSHTGITIRKNGQSVSTAEGSNSYLNHTESSQSNKVGTTASMIPCFPASNGTGVHHCDTISNHRSSSYNLTKDIPSNISQVRTRSTNLHKKYIGCYLRK